MYAKQRYLKYKVCWYDLNLRYEYSNSATRTPGCPGTQELALNTQHKQPHPSNDSDSRSLTIPTLQQNQQQIKYNIMNKIGVNIIMY